MTKEDKNLLRELKDEAYNAEDVVGGYWCQGCGDGDYPEVDKAFQEAKDALVNLFEVTEKILRPNKDDEDYQNWLNRHGVKDE